MQAPILEFSYSVPITEQAGVNDSFVIKGVAINETTTSNNHKFLAEELKMSAPTLNGKPLLIDHNNSVESIKGRVTSSTFSDLGRAVVFEAKVMDKAIQSMIKDGRINSVSIGASVSSVDEEADGVLVPRGIKFKELSLVAVPADENATFAVAMSESYKAKPKVIEAPIPIPTPTVESQSQDTILNERRSNMEEQNKQAEHESIIEMRKQLEESNKLISEFKAKERKEAENKYLSLCQSKKVVALDVKALSDETLSVLTKQVESVVVAKDEVKETKVESKDSVVKAGKLQYRITQTDGSLRGGAFTMEMIK